MSETGRPTLQNRLLRLLPDGDLARLRPELEPVRLELRFVLSAPDQPIDFVYFPERGIASVVAAAADGSRLEVGLFGRDGMSGASLILGVDRTPHETFMQVGGDGLRIRADRLADLLGDCPSLGAALRKFVHVSNIQTAHTAVANGRYTIEERLARWLLMSHDRVDGDEVPMTHEFLAVMLAVRRSGVTVATQVLEGERIIRAERGRITVLDRARLEQAAGGSYGVPEAEYERVIGPMNESRARTAQTGIQG